MSDKRQLRRGGDTPVRPAASSATWGVVGASARAAAFSQLRAGRQVVAADLFADVDLRACCAVTRIVDYPDGFLPWLEQAGCSRWMYTGGLENYPDLVDAMATRCPLVGHQGPHLRRVRNPLVLQAVLQQAGFHFPETQAQNGRACPRLERGAANHSELPRAKALARSRWSLHDCTVLPAQAGMQRFLPSVAPSVLTPEWLGKTYGHSGGRGVGRSPAAPYRQRRISGQPLSAVFYGEQFWGLSQQLVGAAWTGAAPFQYCGSLAPGPLSAAWEAELQRLGAVLSAEFHLTHWYGVDLLAAADQLWIIEVNPRYTASMEVVERARGESGAVFGKAIVFAQQPLLVSAALQQNWLRQAGTLPWPQIADIPPAETAVAPGQPLCTVYAAAATPTEVVRALRDIAHDLLPQYEHGAVRQS